MSQLIQAALRCMFAGEHSGLVDPVAAAMTVDLALFFGLECIGTDVQSDPCWSKMPLR